MHMVICRMLNQWIALSNDLHRIPEPELLEEEGNAESSESPEFFAIHRDVEWRYGNYCTQYYIE